MSQFCDHGYFPQRLIADLKAKLAAATARAEAAEAKLAECGRAGCPAAAQWVRENSPPQKKPTDEGGRALTVEFDTYSRSINGRVFISPGLIAKALLANPEARMVVLEKLASEAAGDGST